MPGNGGRNIQKDPLFSDLKGMNAAIEEPAQGVQTTVLLF